MKCKVRQTLFNIYMDLKSCIPMLTHEIFIERKCDKYALLVKIGNAATNCFFVKSIGGLNLTTFDGFQPL